MKVKVCGITRFDQMQKLDMLNADFGGLIFYKGSKRFIGDSLKSYKNQIKELSIRKVGVFVNASIDEIWTAIQDYGLEAIQLHGDETPLFCKEFAPGVKVIKAFRVNHDMVIDVVIDEYRDVCDYYLFDTLSDAGSSVNYGGSGKRFDWKVLEKYTIDKPFFLSGGIRSDHIHEIENLEHPALYAIDINSGFESETGIKNLVQVEKFINRVRYGKDQPAGEV